MLTYMLWYDFKDRENQPVQAWAFFVNDGLYALTYTTIPRWTVSSVEFELERKAA